MLNFFLVIQASIMKLSWFGLVALMLLWITGFGFAYKIYGGMDLGRAFNIKALGAIVHLAVVVLLITVCELWLKMVKYQTLLQ